MQRQITQKQYKIEQYLQWRTNKKSYMDYRTAQFSMSLNDLNPVLNATLFFDAEYRVVLFV